MVSNAGKYSYLQNNFVDKSFQRALLPLNLLQYTFFLSKYTIRNNFIYPKNYIYHITSFFFVCCLIYSLYDHSEINEASNNKKKIEIMIRFSMNFNFVSYCTDCILLFISNIYNSKNTVRLIQNFQKLARTFRYISNNNFKDWKRGNWIYVGGLYIVYLIIASFFSFIFHYDYVISVSRGLYVFILMYYDVNIICAFRYVKLLKDCLALWVANVQFYSNRSQNPVNKTSKRNVEFHSKEFLDAYFNILNSFDSIKNIFQLPILLQIADSFAHGLIYAQLFIEFGKIDILNNTSIIGILAESLVFGWVTKNIVVLSFCIKECEDFYMNIIEVERNCVTYLGNRKHPELKKLYKNVRRINWAKFSKMSACGVFTVDAALPLRLFDQWAIYIVVLLQFAFH